MSKQKKYIYICGETGQGEKSVYSECLIFEIEKTKRHKHSEFTFDAPSSKYF